MPKFPPKVRFPKLVSLPPLVYSIESFDGDNEIKRDKGSGRGILKVLYHPVICLEGLRNMIKNLDYSRHYAS